MRTPLLASALLSLALVPAAAAQSPLCSINPFASNNGGSVGGAVYFDLNVTSAIRVTSIDTNYSATAGTPVGMTVYTTPGTSVGNETNPAAWTQVAQDDGTALSAGTDNPTSITLAVPLILTPGSYGVALVALGSGHRYTNGNGGNQNFNTAEAALALGKASNVPFTASIFNPRVWNGCIHYTPPSGLFPAFDGSPRSGASPLNVAFADKTYTSDPGGVTSWAWDVDNDGTTDYTDQNPAHVYMAGGKYAVKLDVKDAVASASHTEVDYIDVDPLTVDFSASPTFGTAPMNVQFTDLSQYAVSKWQWDVDNDGTVDYTDQNPSHVYASGGRYTVALTASNALYSATETKVDYIYTVGGTNNTAGAGILELQFNEPRGDQTANAASTTLAPSHANVTSYNGSAAAPGWQGDAGRPLFQGNEPGFGCMAANATSPYQRVDTGLPIDFQGSMTIMFWNRLPGSLGTCYAFGSGSGSSGRCYYTSSVAAWSLRSWGNLPSTINSATNPSTLAGWNHWCFVIDDTAGTCQWYLNGVADGAPTMYTPGTFSYQASTNFVIGNYGTTSSCASRYMDYDDFRIYGKALSAADIAAAMAAENPAATTFAAGCSGPAATPTIAAAGGPPAVGNASFQVDVDGIEVGAPAALNLGIAVDLGGALPYDASWLLGAGCLVDVLPQLTSISLVHAGSASVGLSIPADPTLAGVHVYAQCLVVGSTGAISPALDINIQ